MPPPRSQLVRLLKAPSDGDVANPAYRRMTRRQWEAYRKEQEQPSSNKMTTDNLNDLISQLEHNLKASTPNDNLSLLTRSKLALLHANGLVPTPSTPADLLAAAQHILSLGALTSIHLGDEKAFTRYFLQLQPFYSHPSAPPSQQRSKITGLYLLLLLSQGDYAGFHTLLESLEVVPEKKELGRGKGFEEDEFVQYPVRLEQWLMEGSYDRVWEETKSERVPSTEFAIFSNILQNTIRNEIASCSEKAYPSIPVTNAKSLLYLDSEGSVIDFSSQQGWTAQDGRVYFEQEGGGAGDAEAAASATDERIIENALGYARELEMIV